MLCFLSGQAAREDYFPEWQLPGGLSCSRVDPLLFPSRLVLSTSETLLQSRGDRINERFCMKNTSLRFIFITFQCNISKHITVSSPCDRAQQGRSLSVAYK